VYFEMLCYSVYLSDTSSSVRRPRTVSPKRSFTEKFGKAKDVLFVELTPGNFFLILGYVHGLESSPTYFPTASSIRKALGSLPRHGENLSYLLLLLQYGENPKMHSAVNRIRAKPQIILILKICAFLSTQYIYIFGVMSQ
jgi:hypothetical protein